MSHPILSYIFLAAAAIILVLVLSHGDLDEIVLIYYHSLVTFVGERHITALLIFALAYGMITAIGTPGSAIMTLIAGVLFGGLAGAMTSIIAASLGGTILFLAVRTGFAHVTTKRLPHRFHSMMAGFRRDGLLYLLVLRLTPLLPFFIVNLVAAAAGLRLSHFLVATFIGIAPMNFAIAYTGAGMQDVIAAQAHQFLVCQAQLQSACSGLSLGDFLNRQVLLPLSAFGLIILIPIAMRRFMVRDTKSSERNV